jgi:hypothetical protein
MSNWQDLTTKEGLDSLWANHAPYDRNGNNEIGTYLKNFAAFQYPQIARELGFQGELQPGYENTIKRLLMLMSSGGMDAAKNRDRQSAMSNASAMQRQGNFAARSQGMGQEIQEGMALDSRNRLNENLNGIDQKYNDPMFRAQAPMQAMGIYQNALGQGPAMQRLISMFAPVEQRHQQNKSEVGSGSAFAPFVQAAMSYFGGR